MPTVEQGSTFTDSNTDSSIATANRPVSETKSVAEPVRLSPRRLAVRIAGGLLWIAAIAAGFYLVYVEQSHLKPIRAFVDHHWLLAPSFFLVIYLLSAVLALPVLWLLALAGMCFGIFYGSVISLSASTAGAVCTVALVRSVAGDWFHERVESKLHKLRNLDETLGHNGFLVVMTLRLMHSLPFGLSNYALGLSRISVVDVALGTVIGNIPAITLYVGIGAGYHFERNWRFAIAIGSMNVILLVPMALRYLKPKWFKKIGVD